METEIETEKYKKLKLKNISQLKSHCKQDINTLKEQREARFFKKQVLPSGSLLHYLLPDRRDNDIINMLRNPKPFLTRARTHKFRSSYLILWTISYRQMAIRIILFY